MPSPLASAFRPRLLSVAFVAILAVSACSKRGGDTPPVATKCVVDADCTYSCAGHGDCCPMPCGCTIPMHKDDKAAAEAYNATHCGPKEHALCPVVGGCGPSSPPPPLACVAGKCASGKPVPPPG